MQKFVCDMCHFLFFPCGGGGGGDGFLDWISSFGGF